jgi:hypothetical protein
MAEIFSAFIDLFLSMLRRNPVLRTVLAIGSTVPLLAAVWIYVGMRIFPDWWAYHLRLRPDLISQPLWFIVIALGGLFTLVAASYLPDSKLKIGGLEIELEPLRKERQEIRERIDQDKAAPKIFDTIQLGLNQITEYYTINKSQAKKSFAFSVFSVIAGLLTLIGGVWLFYLGKANPNVKLTALSGIGGILLQFIGGASFYIYNKSLDQLNFFYDKLIRMQDTMLSIQLLNDVSDKERQDTIRERVILEIITRHGEQPPKTNSRSRTQTDQGHPKTPQSNRIPHVEPRATKPLRSNRN